MGKRKERRLAAMAAGRRVKLDIFTEPSGDSGGFSAQDELGGDIDPRHRDGSPSSPSSSGKQPENPLLLLGQYSDDELDEESCQSIGHATPEKASIVDNEQVNGPVDTENEGLKDEGSVDYDAYKDKQQRDLESTSVSRGDSMQNLEENEPEQIHSIGADHLCKEDVAVEETSIPGTSDVHSTDDANTSWKVVLHEESNQYYYWNTVTGETSWVVPNVLASRTKLICEQETAPDAEERSDFLAVIEQPNSTSDVELDGSSTVHIGGYSIAANVSDAIEENDEPGPHMEELIDEQKDESLEDNTLGPDASQAEKYISNVMVHEDNGPDNDLCSAVLKHGEFLLERLKSMEGSKSHEKGNDWTLKYTLEIGVRVSDIKSLLSFGSSLLPFWVHCERKLKELEVAIDTEGDQFFIPDKIDEVGATHTARKSEGIQIEANRNKSSTVISDVENCNMSAYVDISPVVQEVPQIEAANCSVLHGEHVSATYHSTPHSGSSLGGNIGGSETVQLTESTSETVLHDGEDVDMDVDMEVEDTKEPHIQPNPPVESVSFSPQEEFGVPPPPSEDWIPPPPPDSELVPPPPPDDPTEPSYPPPPPDEQPESSYAPAIAYSQPVQPLAYTEQYSFTYQSPSLEYYGQTNTEFPANNVYQQAEGSHIAVPNPPVYYETLPTSYPGATPVLLNPTESVPYYDFNDGAVIPGHVVSAPELSGVHGGSGHEAIGSDNISTTNLHMEMSCASLSNAEVGVSAVNGGTEKGSIGIPSVQARANTNSVVESGPVPSATAVTTISDSAKSATTSVQSKVRSKKRTIAAAPTLRSNKKVSSLVDKWKAAKEELHEDEEDEPESAYEILEKKRQREIEKWRAQQIASGEAKVNANFQPLGGDWRERVKRKRAQLKNEATEPLSVVSNDGNKHPDLSEISRDLPSGWQAYWDESSKQVYYGNAITSETTWTRPGK